MINLALLPSGIVCMLSIVLWTAEYPEYLLNSLVLKDGIMMFVLTWVVMANALYALITLYNLLK